MAILSKALRKFYLAKSEAASANETPADIGYFTDATPPGWFESIVDNSSPAINSDCFQGSEPDQYWKRIVESTGPTPTSGNPIVRTYVAGTEFENDELVVLDDVLYLTTSTHTPTAQEVTDKDHIEPVSSTATGISDLIPRAFVDNEDYKAKELVHFDDKLWFVTSEITGGANVADESQLTSIDTDTNDNVVREYAEELFKAGELVRVGTDLYISGTEHTPTSAQVASLELLTKVDTNTTDNVVREYAEEEFALGELVRIGLDLYVSNELHTPSAAEVTTPTKLTKVDTVLEVLIPAFDPVEEYPANAPVRHDGFIWTSKGTHSTNDAFGAANFDRSVPAIYRGEHSASAIYLAGDVVVSAGTEYKCKVDGTTGAFDNADFDRISNVLFTAYANDTEYLRGDLINESRRTYYVDQGFTSGAADSIDDHLANLVIISDDSFSIVTEYTDGADLMEGQFFFSGDMYFRANEDIDGTVDVNLAAVEAKSTRLFELPQEAVPFVAADLYVEDDRVIHMGLEYTKNSTARAPGEAFAINQWTRKEPSGYDHGEGHVANQVLLNGDFITLSGIKYRLTVNHLEATVPVEGTHMVRVSAEVFETFEDDKQYIVGDMILEGEKSFRVKADFVIDSGTSETWKDHEASLQVISNDEYSKLRVYSDGMDLEEFTLFIYDGSIYFTPVAIDGTVTSTDTWDEIKTTVKEVAKLGDVLPAFDSSLVYNDGDKVSYKGFVFTRNATARTANDPFTLAQFDRDLPAGEAFQAFVADIPYLAGDTVLDGGLVYEVNTDSDNISALVEGPGAGQFTRITSKVFTTWSAAASIYSKGDVFYLGDRSFYAKDAFTTALNDTVDTHAASLQIISDDVTNKVRAYADGDSFETGEFLSYNSGLYFVDSGWVADVAGNTNHEWAAVEANCTLVTSVAVQTSVPFNAPDVYAEGDLVEFEGYVFTRNNTARTAGDDFSLTHFDRNISGGQRRGALSTTTHYLAGDIVTIAGRDYRINENVDHDSGGANVLVEGLTGPGTYNRINAEVFTSVEADKVYIPRDIVLEGKRTFVIITPFVSAAVDPTLIGDANAVKLSDDHVVQAPTYEADVTYEAGSLFKHEQALYFVHTEVLAVANTEFDDMSSAIAKISDAPQVAPVLFDTANAYAEGDRVNFQNYIWKRNASPRTAGDAFSITQFDRETPGGVDRGDFATAEHLLDGDTFWVNGIEYEALADKDVTVDQATFVVPATAKRIGNLAFSELTANTEYVKNDLFRIDYRTYIALADFMSTNNGDATDTDPEEYTGLILLTEDDRSLTREYVDGDSLVKGEMFRQGNGLYLAESDIDGTAVGSDTWSEVEPLVTLVLDYTPAPANFVAADTYTQGDKVVFGGHVFTRNAVARTAGDTFSTTHFDRELVQVDHGAVTEANVTALVLLPGDRFEITGIQYSAMLVKETAVTFASLTDGTDYMRLTPQTFNTFNVGDVFIPDDVITSPDHYDYLVTNDITVVDPDPETYADLEAINISDTYYLDGSTPLAYHDHQKRGHRWIVTADNAVSMTGYTIPAGYFLYLKEDKTSSDTPAYSDFYVHDPDTLLKEPVPFVEADAYGADDRVIFTDGFVYRVIDPSRPAGTQFTMTDFERELPGGQFVGEMTSDTIFYAGDTMTFNGDNRRATDTKDFGMNTQFGEFRSVRTNAKTFVGLSNQRFIIGDVVELDDYSVRIHTAYSSGASPTLADLLTNGDVIDVEREYTLGATDTITYHDYHVAGHRWLVTAENTTVFSGSTVPAGTILVLKADKTSADSAVLADFDVYLADELVAAPDPQYTLSGSVNFGSAPGVVIDKDTANINVKDTTHVTWVSNGTEDVVTLVSVLVNGVDQTAEFEVVDTDSIKIKTASSLGLYGDDDIVVTYE